MGTRILLVDDEEDIVWTLTRQLSRERPDFDVEGYVDARQALDRLQEAPPDLLISDVRMPKLSGLELLIEARRAVPDLPIILMTAYGTSELRQEVAKRSAVEYLEKPYEFPALLSTIDRLLSRDRGFSGAISLSLLPDLVQIHALSRVSGALRISREGRVGSIWFQKGGIVHAECGEHAGAEAFYELLRWEGGKFALDPASVPPRQTIFESPEELLMEGCRRLDEERHAERDSSAATLHEPPPFPETAAPRPDASPAIDGLASEIPGFIAASIVDLDSGATAASSAAPAGFDLSAASASSREIVTGHLKAIEALGMRSQLEDVLLTLSDQIHFIKLMSPSRFLYLAADSATTNLVAVRAAVKRHAAGLT